jgi:hypothetical protein
MRGGPFGEGDGILAPPVPTRAVCMGRVVSLYLHQWGPLGGTAILRVASAKTCPKVLTAQDAGPLLPSNGTDAPAETKAKLK